MKSMTGFGSAEGRESGRRITVEVNSINSRKGADIFVNTPRELEGLDRAAREKVQQLISRGRVTVTVRLESVSSDPEALLHINRPLLQRYHAELTEAAQQLGVQQEITIDTLLRLPGVTTAEDDSELRQALSAAALALLDSALKEYDESRSREGKHLCDDLLARVDSMEKGVEVVKTRAPEVPVLQRERLMERLQQADISLELDDERLLKELAFFADRCDIAEEITRLGVHLNEVRRLLNDSKSSGRNLDFLSQEIGREVNTIGSKANDLEISRQVVDLKGELERIKEQVANLE